MKSTSSILRNNQSVKRNNGVNKTKVGESENKFT